MSSAALAPLRRDHPIATRSWRALGTTVVVRITEPDALDEACALAVAELDAIDRACSRFRADSELERLNAGDGRPAQASPLLLEAIEVALRAARLTEGDVDPTGGRAIELAGYACDWERLDRPRPGTAPALRPPEPPSVRASFRGGWQRVEVDTGSRTVRLPRGVRLDLGATAKALAADRAAAAIHRGTGAGALVCLGGDLATAGRAPGDGWAVHVTDDHRGTPDDTGQTVTIATGGLATSSTSVRRWLHAGREMHHILDPATGQPVQEVWRTASVAAASCVDANIASTATIVRGLAAVAWLSTCRLPARLVTRAGGVRLLAGWPSDRLARVSA